MQQIIVTKETEGQRLDKLLAKYLDDAPKSFLYKMLRKKNIKYNHKKATGNEIVNDGDIVEIYMTDETIAKFRKDKTVPKLNFDAEDKIDSNLNSKIQCKLAKESVDSSLSITQIENPIHDIEIIYEDNDVIILNKPAGELSQKAVPSDYSLNEKIVDYYHLKKSGDSLFTPSVCNRLDRNTSGIILAGMSLKGSRVLSRMLKSRTLDKYYLTIVCGNVKKAADIKGFLTKKASHNQVVIFNTLEEAKENGVEKPAFIETRYEPLAHGKFKDMDFTLLKVKLVTGKTHQIRAHLCAAYHPIIGDGKYGRKSVNTVLKKEFGLKHQMLHAYEISFPKEDEGEVLEALCGKIFHAELSEQFKEITNCVFGKNVADRFSE